MTPSMSTSSFQSDWQDLCSFLNKWYYKPDLEGLRIVLCTYLSHFYLTSPPVWLSIIGIPGSGKTELGIKPLIPLSSCITSISTLTVNSFLSGFGENNGLLDRLTPITKGSTKTHGIWLFTDLTTTLLAEDPFSRTKIMGALRKIYDGDFDKEVGNKKEALRWQGKVTCIAACTPVIEEYWSLHRDMGERWLNIRWGNLRPSYVEKKEISRYSRRQEGYEDRIKKELHDRIHSLLESISDGPNEVPESDMLDAAGILLEECRTNIKRDSSGKVVVDRGNQQLNTRIAKSLSVICKASAALRRDDKFTDEDFKLAIRIAIDSIPYRRWTMLKRLVALHPSPVTKTELALNLDVPRGSFDTTLEDLRYLKIVEIEDQPDNDELGLTDEPFSQNTYDYKKPNRMATIRLSVEIIEVIHDMGLL